MIRDIPLYVKGPKRYSRYDPYENCFMENERAILGEIEARTPIEPPPTFKQPVTNTRGFHAADGKAVLIADQEHHFDEVMAYKATLKQFIAFRRDLYPAAKLPLQPDETVEGFTDEVAITLPDHPPSGNTASDTRDIEGHVTDVALHTSPPSVSPSPVHTS